MSTLAQITAAIDDDIRNKTPLVLKAEHADVEQLITDEMFPDSVVIEWNGTTPVNPITDIVCNSVFLINAKCSFKIFFTKVGNRVFYKGAIGAYAGSITLTNITIATFATSLYKPLTDHSSRSPIIINNGSASSNVLPNCTVLVDRVLGFRIQGSTTQGNVSLFFEGSYKVAN
jgi:hypothetical protein